MTSNFSSAWFVGEESILSVDPGKALGVEGRTKGSLRAYSHLPCLVRTKPKKITGADLLGWWEYKPSNSGADQPAGPRPSPRGGLGSLPNQPWCGSLEM